MVLDGWGVSDILESTAGYVGTGSVFISFTLSIGLMSVASFSGGGNLWNVAARSRILMCVSVPNGGSIMLL